MDRRANVVWQGSGPEGQGRITTQSGAFTDQPYGAKARFQSEDGKAGTNPEELIAAAHAGCFTMALAFRLTNAGHPPQELRTEARVEMAKTDAGWSIPKIHLITTGAVPGIDAAKFGELANDAKANCPVSKALSAVPITLDAKLVG
jgi:osmotically inducible protein OsmC